MESSRIGTILFIACLLLALAFGFSGTKYVKEKRERSIELNCVVQKGTKDNVSYVCRER